MKNPLGRGYQIAITRALVIFAQAEHAGIVEENIGRGVDIVGNIENGNMESVNIKALTC